MATRGIASSIPGISSFSSSGNSFSIKNLLNLSDGAVEQQKWISKDGASVNVFDPQCSTPPLLVAPRAMFPLGYHRPLLSPSLPVGIFSLPPSRSATQITPFNFPSHVCSPGKYVGKRISHELTARLTAVDMFSVSCCKNGFALYKPFSENQIN